ncbi:MAG TPA: hypothetical protein VHL52_05930 [Acidimicrobiia bacterium]|nr:hypothetical protein [Acidimicrobiia bacterium]
MDIEVLGLTETARRRPFTSPDLYLHDRAILAQLAADLRELLDRGRHVKPYEPIEWTLDGLKRRVIVCDPVALRGGIVDVSMVGFFGERNLDRDGAPLEEANAEIVLEFRNYPGILSYSSTELADGNWANLVLHDKPDTREYWRASHRHAQAAEHLSPLYYRTVRIHNGVLPGGLYGERPVLIERTKYWDFGGRKMWRAVRELPPLAATTG